uniref:NADH dehydrogenase subunit 3 n=1 Tax=Bolbosoma nipponicum TaxID=1167864 RepID=UPI002E779156|nr:NADH dehydrogenase subunit 3 [Bolbosoma nipponicum]WPN89832.1 NADH dehydrogenase subunit 3 [Bolbosoma nipponicum]
MVVFISLGICFLLVFVVVLTSLAIGSREGLMVGCESSFESGFMTLSKEMDSLSVRFFVLAVVFLLLDLETAVLLTTPLSLGGFGEILYGVMLVVVWVYVVGTLYEWFVGSLDWFC